MIPLHLLVFCLPFPIFSRSIVLYDINKNLPPTSVHCKSCPDPECVSTRKKFELPNQFTICFRFHPVSVMFGQDSYGLVSLTYESINMTKENKTEGLVWGTWGRTPWFGIWQNSSLQWMRLGDGKEGRIHGWKHRCLSINWDAGELVLVENGEVIFDQTIPELTEAYKKMNHTLNTIRIGCMHTHGHDNLSSRGPVTDVHLYSRNLRINEMKKFTDCHFVYPQGDIVNWNTTDWLLQSKSNFSESVITSFEKDVCFFSNTTTVLIPESRSFPDPCQVLSGSTVGYHTKEELFSLSGQIARRSNMADRGLCMSSLPNNTFKTFLPTVIKRSTWWVWINQATRSNVTFFPWAQGRPVVKADVYDCVFLELTVHFIEGHEFGDLKSVEIEGNKS